MTMKKSKQVESQKMRGEHRLVVGKQYEEKVPAGGRTQVRRNCRDCVIVQINDTGFTRNSQMVQFEVSENTDDFVIRATPSIENCGCTWSNIDIMYILILTGNATGRRADLLRMPQLIEQRPARIDRNPDFFQVENCTLHIRISRINQALRNRNVNEPGFHTQGIPLGLCGKVRCNSRWREFRIRITDA